MKKKGLKKVGNFLKSNYSKSFLFLKHSKNYIFFCFVLFVLFFLVGFFVKLPVEIMDVFFEIINNLMDKIKDKNGLEIIGFIFLNNLQVSFLGLFGGVLFGVLPILFVVFNGFFVGVVSSIVVFEEGILSLWRLFPHGIFELPAVFISLGIGMKMGFTFFRENSWIEFKKSFVESVRIFIFIVIPLLLIGAIIEGFLISFS